MNRQQFAQTVAEAYVDQYSDEGSPVMNNRIIVYATDDETFSSQSSLTPLHDSEVAVMTLSAGCFGDVDANDPEAERWIADYLVDSASDEIWRDVTQAIERENASALRIVSIQTKPERDPYTDIDGYYSRTYLKLDPRAMIVWVTQEYNDNSTPIDEYHGLVLTWSVPNHPLESDMRGWVESHMSDLQRICDGYEDVWNGSNHVGQLTEDAYGTREAIRGELSQDLDYMRHYETWSVEAWTEPMLSEINADTTDDQLRDMANEAITALDANQILDGDEDKVYRYFAGRRDDLRWERETYSEPGEE